jgi:hypothetical protein
MPSILSKFSKKIFFFIENPNFKVLVVEMGAPNAQDPPYGDPYNDNINFPQGYGPSSPHDPAIFSIPQEVYGNNSVWVPRYYGLGGTSQIYGCLVLRHPYKSTFFYFFSPPPFLFLSSSFPLLSLFF